MTGEPPWLLASGHRVIPYLLNLRRRPRRLPDASDGARSIWFARPMAIGFGAAVALLLLVAPASVFAADPLGDLTEPVTGLLSGEGDAGQNDAISTPTEPVATVTEPVTSAVEPVFKPVTETVVQPVTNAVLQPVTEVVLQPVSEAVLEPVVEAVAPVVSNVVEETEPLTQPLTEPLTNEPVTDPPEYEPPGVPEWQPAADPLPDSEPAAQPEEPGLARPTDPGSPVASSRSRVGMTHSGVLGEAAKESIFDVTRSTPAGDSPYAVPSVPGPGPSLLRLPLFGGGSDSVLGSLSIGLAIGLALLLLFLMPPPFLVRRLNLAAAFWRPLCFVSPLERPG